MFVKFELFNEDDQITAWQATARQRLDSHLELSWLEWAGREWLPETYERAMRLRADEDARRTREAKAAAEQAKKVKKAAQQEAREAKRAAEARLKKASQASFLTSEDGDAIMSDAARSFPAKRGRAETVTSLAPRPPVSIVN
jgi:hypothetical protein